MDASAAGMFQVANSNFYAASIMQDGTRLKTLCRIALGLQQLAAANKQTIAAGKSSAASMFQTANANFYAASIMQNMKTEDDVVGTIALGLQQLCAATKMALE
jgi:hypothetical protein